MSQVEPLVWEIQRSGNRSLQHVAWVPREGRSSTPWPERGRKERGWLSRPPWLEAQAGAAAIDWPHSMPTGEKVGRCNTPCFCLVSNSTNDPLNQVTIHPWSTLGQTQTQNPNYSFVTPCLPRTFGAFSKIHLNTSNSPNGKVVQFVEAHNFHVGWHCWFEVQIGENLKSTHDVTIH
jgi:hypothetical protein